MPGPNSLGTCKWAWYRLAWQLNLKSPSLKPAQSQKWWNEMERNSGIKNNLQNSPAASPSLSPTDSTSYGLHHEGTLLSPTEVRQARPDQRSTINTVKFYRHKMKSNQMEVANDTKISWKQSPKMVSKMAPHWWLNANIGSKNNCTLAAEMTIHYIKHFSQCHCMNWCYALFSWHSGSGFMCLRGALFCAVKVFNERPPPPGHCPQGYLAKLAWTA